MFVQLHTSPHGGSAFLRETKIKTNRTHRHTVTSTLYSNLEAVKDLRGAKTKVSVAFSRSYTYVGAFSTAKLQPQQF